MSSPLQRTEIWSDYQAAGGARIAVVPVSALSALEAQRNTRWENRLTVEIDNSHVAVGEFVGDRVFRLLFADGSFEEWRIRDREDGLKQGGLRVRCDGVASELGRYGLLTVSDTAGVVTPERSFDNASLLEVVTAVLTECPGWWSAGTITPTARVSFKVSWPSPLKILREAVAAAQAQQVDAELDITRNGTVGYRIAIPDKIGSSAAVVDLRTKKNLLDVGRLRARGNAASRVYPQGGASTYRTGEATMALAWWRVASVSGSDVELRGMEGAADPIAYDDQYNNYYLLKRDGSYTQITDCVASTQKVTVASTASMAAGDRARITKTATGGDLIHVDRPGVPVRVAVLPITSRSDRTNWVRNPVFSRFTASAPDEWTIVDGNWLTVSQDTVRAKFGASSLKCVTDAAGTAQPYVRSEMLVIPPRGAARTVSASVWIYIHTNGGTDFPLVSVQLARSDGVLIDFDSRNSSTDTTIRDVWTRFDVSGSVPANFDVQIWVTIGSPFQNHEWNIGGVDLEVVATPPTDLVVGSEPAFLVAAANRYLLDHEGDDLTVTIQAIDLERLEPGVAGLQEFAVGASANVRVPELGITATGRLVDVVADYKDPARNRVTFSSYAPNLVRGLATGRV